MNASNSKRNVPVGGLASQKKYVDRNLNAVVKAPVVHHGSNKYMQVLHTGKQTKPSKAIGVAAAPTPVNTASLKRENNGRDISVNLVPVSNAVWGQGDGKGDAAEKSQEEAQAKPSVVSSTIAPWADKSGIQKMTTSQSSEDKPRISWAVDSDEDEDEADSSAVVQPSIAPREGVYQSSELTASEERDYSTPAYRSRNEITYQPPAYISSSENMYRSTGYAPSNASRRYPDSYGSSQQRTSGDQVAPSNSRADAAFGPPTSNRDFSSHFQRHTSRGPPYGNYHREHFSHGDRGYNDARVTHQPHNRQPPLSRRYEQDASAASDGCTMTPEELAIEESRKERELLERRKQEQLQREEEERKQREAAQKSASWSTKGNDSSDRWERGRPLVPKGPEESPNRYIPPPSAQRGPGGAVFPSQHPQIAASLNRSGDLNISQQADAKKHDTSDPISHHPQNTASLNRSSDLYVPQRSGATKHDASDPFSQSHFRRNQQQPLAWKSSQISLERPVILAHSTHHVESGAANDTSEETPAQLSHKRESQSSESVEEKKLPDTVIATQKKKILPPPQRMLYDPKRNTMVATSSSNGVAGDDVVQSSTSTTGTRPHRDVSKHDSEWRARRDARVAEKAEHGPRSRGLLYRYDASGELELVLSPDEQAKLDADRALIREKQAARQAAIESKNDSAIEASKLSADGKKSKTKRDAGNKLNSKKGRRTPEDEDAEGGRLKLEDADFVDDDELLEVQRNSVEFMEVKSRKALLQQRKDTKRDATRTQRPGASGNKKSTNSGTNDTSGSVLPLADALPQQRTVSPPGQIAVPSTKAWVEPKQTLETLGVRLDDPPKKDHDSISPSQPEGHEETMISTETSKKSRNPKKRESRKDTTTKTSSKPSLNTSMIRHHLGIKFKEGAESDLQEHASDQYARFSTQIESFGDGQDSAVFSEEYFNAPADNFMQFGGITSESRLLNKVIHSVDDETDMHTQWAIDMVDDSTSIDVPSVSQTQTGDTVVEEAVNRHNLAVRETEGAGRGKGRAGNRGSGRSRGGRGRGRSARERPGESDADQPSVALNDDTNNAATFTSKRLRRPERGSRGGRRGRSNLPRSGPPAKPVTGDRVVE